MSIRCLQQGRLPALPISPAPMPDEPFITLTEVVTQALYGAPLTPGSNGTLRKAMDAVCIAQLVWHGVRYPPKATAVLEIFSDPSPPLAPDEIEKQVEELSKDPPDWFLGCASQFRSTGHDPESVFNWMAKHDNDFTSIECSTAEACDRFYRNLSQAVANGQIVLWGRRAAGDEPPSADHEPIDPRYLLTRRHHDLLSNELHEEVRNRDELLAFSRGGRAHLSAAICYHDIKTSKAHAEKLGATYAHLPAGTEPSTGKAEPSKPRYSGRRQQSGPYARKDAVLIDKMQKLMTRRNNPLTRYAAAQMVAQDAEGSPHADSKARRLVGKHKKKYPDGS